MSRRGQPGCLATMLAVGVLGFLAVALLAGGDDPAARPEVPDSPRWSVDEDPGPPGRAEPTRRRPAEARFPFADVAEAEVALDTLPVKGRAPLTDYTREAFGPAWPDANGNGCDTRNDILRRDLTDKVVEDCVVLSGVLDDPYSGVSVDFTRGPITSLDVQIDHVVALANAWQTGAAYWPLDKRLQFANDRRNLLAVRGDLNLQKRDGDAATWLPPRKSFRCTYVAIQILTKQRHGLWVTAPEKAAMKRILQRC